MTALWWTRNIQTKIKKKKKGFCILDLEAYREKVTDVGKQQLQTNYKEKAWGKQNKFN